MKLRQGRTFIEAPPHTVADFLRKRRLETVLLPADHLCVAVRGEELILQVMNGRFREYPLRETFFLKLLKWGSLPPAGISRLSIETIAGILNDLLLSIRSANVSVKIEDGEALTITSPDYCELPDLDVIQTLLPLGIAGITRTDFFIRVYGRIRAQSDIVPGDTCGFGFNILNSETGFRALSAWHFILRYVCSNGAMVRTEGGLKREIHYRHPKGYLLRLLQERLQPIERAHERLIEALLRSTRSPIPHGGAPIHAMLRRAIGRRNLQALLAGLPEPPSLYDLFNLVTAYARGFAPGQRLRLEALAGDLLFHEKPPDSGPVFDHSVIRKSEGDKVH